MLSFFMLFQRVMKIQKIVARNYIQPGADGRGSEAQPAQGLSSPTDWPSYSQRPSGSNESSYLRK